MIQYSKKKQNLSSDPKSWTSVDKLNQKISHTDIVGAKFIFYGPQPDNYNKGVFSFNDEVVVNYLHKIRPLDVIGGVL